MGLGGTEMRFGEAAISVASAPMEMGTGRKDMPVTEISIAEAPMAVAVTAMRIGTRKKKMAAADSLRSS